MFHLFAGNYSPHGGLEDYKGSFDELETAKQFFHSHLEDYTWGQIGDSDLYTVYTVKILRIGNIRRIDFISPNEQTQSFHFQHYRDKNRQITRQQYEEFFQRIHERERSI